MFNIIIANTILNIKMGSKVSKEETECFNDIRFILTAFRNKYSEYPDFNKLPKYGLDRMIENLETPRKINWKIVQDFVRILHSWRVDTSFILTVENTFMSNNYNIDILSSYYLDVNKLEEKIKEIIEKYKSNKNVDKMVNRI